MQMNIQLCLNIKCMLHTESTQKITEFHKKKKSRKKCKIAQVTPSLETCLQILSK